MDGRPAMNPLVLRVTKLLVGVALVGLGAFFVIHHGIFVLGILALPGLYLIWDGFRAPKGPTAPSVPKK